MKNYFLLATGLFVIGCASTNSISDRHSQSQLRACHTNGKAWDVFPGHFYDKEIHLVPVFPDYKTGSVTAGTSHNPEGYSVVFIQPGSYYDQIGIQNGDVITQIDDSNLNFKDLTALSNEDQKVFKKIKQGKKFTLSRCLTIE